MGCTSSHAAKDIAAQPVLRAPAPREAFQVEEGPAGKFAVSRGSKRSAPKPDAGAISRAQLIESKRGEIRDAYRHANDKVGQGAFGSVSRASHRTTGVVRAVKKIGVKDVVAFRQETVHLKAMDHPNIIRLYETYEDKKSVYLVLEFCGGGDLFDRIRVAGHLGECDSAMVMQGVLRAVHYMHGRDIVHRDLKPENFMLVHNGAIRDNVVKLIDFGTAKACQPTATLSSKVGTSFYMAPQVLRHKYGRECDLWSAGVVLFVMLSGTVPFPGNTDNQVFEKVREGRYSFAARVWKRVTAEAQSFVRKLICFSPRTRLTAEEALAHSWLTTSPMTSRPASFDEEDVQHICTYSSQSFLKKSALQFIAGQLEDTQLKGLREQFMSLDSDHDGTLTVAELSSGMKQAGIERSTSSVNRLVSSVDANGNGTIDYTEFLAAALAKDTYLDKDLCTLAFNAFDRDGDGLISQSELVIAFRDQDKQSLMRGIRDVMQEVDLDGDGSISFEEFMQMMQQSGQQRGAFGGA